MTNVCTPTHRHTHTQVCKGHTLLKRRRFRLKWNVRVEAGQLFVCSHAHTVTYTQNKHTHTACLHTHTLATTGMASGPRHVGAIVQLELCRSMTDSVTESPDQGASLRTGRHLGSWAGTIDTAHHSRWATAARVVAPLAAVYWNYWKIPPNQVVVNLAL